jgi:hypothetical protein
MTKRTSSFIAAIVAMLLFAPACVTTTRGRLYVRTSPPPVVVERAGIAPGPGYVWQPGYYRWAGREYIWVPGHYAAVPRPHARWVPGHWQRDRGGWYFVAGHWR